MKCSTRSSPFSSAASFGWTELKWISHYHQPEGRDPIPKSIPPHYECVELVTAGHGWIEDQGQWREVLPGDLIWNQPGDMTIGRSDYDDPYRCLAVTLTGKKTGSGLPRFSQWPDLDEVRTFAREAMRLFLDEEFDRRALLEYVAGQLLFRVRMHCHGEGRRELPPQLSATLELLERDYAQPCRIEELAACAGWSVAHLHEVFRRHLQITPHQMLLRLRLRAAKQRLTTTNQPVKQIAIECGFADAAAFANIFKNATGLTPGGYRQRCMRLTS